MPRICAAVSAFLLLSLSVVTSTAQSAPVQVIQTSDGTLYLAQGTNAWTMAPNVISDDELAPFAQSGELDGAIPSPFLRASEAMAPLNIVQSGDGTLHLVQSGNVWLLIPAQISDADLGALSVVGQIGGDISAPALSQPASPAATAPPAQVAQPASTPTSAVGQAIPTNSCKVSVDMPYQYGAGMFYPYCTMLTINQPTTNTIDPPGGYPVKNWGLHEVSLFKGHTYKVDLQTNNFFGADPTQKTTTPSFPTPAPDVIRVKDSMATVRWVADSAYIWFPWVPINRPGSSSSSNNPVSLWNVQCWALPDGGTMCWNFFVGERNTPNCHFQVLVDGVYRLRVDKVEVPPYQVPAEYSITIFEQP